MTTRWRRIAHRAARITIVGFAASAIFAIHVLVDAPNLDAPPTGYAIAALILAALLLAAGYDLGR